MDIFLLVNEAKQGDKEALLQLILLRQSDYYKLAYVYLKNQDDAMDALEEMIIILFHKLHSLKNNESFYSWSKTILVNVCKDILKKRKKLVLINEQDEQPYIEKYENKESLNKSFNIDDTKVKLTELIASPTLTVINGKLTFDKGVTVDYVTSPTIDMELWADGKQLNKEGQGIGSTISGYSFDISFDGLPSSFKELELRLKGVSVCERVNSKIPFDFESTGKIVTIAGQEIEIKDVFTKANLTELTLLYNENVSLLEVALEVDGEKISLNKADVVNHYKTPKGVIQKEILITFPTKIEKANLIIGNISYPKKSDLVLPLN